MNGVSWGEQCGNSGPFHLSSSALPRNSPRVSAALSPVTPYDLASSTAHLSLSVSISLFLPQLTSNQNFFSLSSADKYLHCLCASTIKHLYASVTAPSFQSPPQPLWPPCSDPWSHWRGGVGGWRALGEDLGADDINSLDLMNLSSSIMWADVWGEGLGGWIS